MSKINQNSGNDQGNKEEVIIIKEDLWDRGLPTELLELILSKLMFVVDIQKFHCVCKTWRSITVSVSPPRQLPSPLPYADSSFPLLFQIMDDDRNKYRVFHPLYNYTWDMHFPPQVADGHPKKIYFSKYGWSLILAMSKDRDWYLFLFNPLTKEMIELPAMPEFPGFSTSMFFTCPPSQPDCFVVAIAGRHSSSIYVHKLGEDDWKKHDLKGKILDPRFEPICHPILYQGLCYCLDQNRNLAEFDIRDIQHSWIVHENSIPSRREVSVPANLTALVEHDGQLLVVFIGLFHLYTYKLDLKTKSCDLQSLGKNALFISGGASFSQRAVLRATGNKIFIPFLKKKTDSFLFYSFATGKYHSFFDNLSSKHLGSDIAYLFNSSWLPM
ncbi:hypothetical protein COLO4_14733 [Corchorus olitorius]|uniref:F-box domain-containing protein n=1 Tax=Corchorus olitorius TaxID=93759 RepID=A0A1R3JR18_9ROSI|nr:hypothetical protein COLO4_14733 [Corchorus olitorius]